LYEIYFFIHNNFCNDDAIIMTLLVLKAQSPCETFSHRHRKTLLRTGRFQRQRCLINCLLMTSQWRRCLQIFIWCFKLNFLHCVYFEFFIFSKLTLLHQFVTYLLNDLRTTIIRSTYVCQ